MPQDLKLSQISSSLLLPPFRGLHSPGVRKHCPIIFTCYFREATVSKYKVGHCSPMGDFVVVANITIIKVNSVTKQWLSEGKNQSSWHVLVEIACLYLIGLPVYTAPVCQFHSLKKMCKVFVPNHHNIYLYNPPSTSPPPIAPPHSPHNPSTPPPASSSYPCAIQTHVLCTV